jgi:ribonuclease HII
MEQELIIGVDDSGRGPVIGPMILAGVLMKVEDEEKLRKLGVRDSKTLTPSRREILASETKKYVLDFNISVTEPSEIDSRTEMGTNLNKIEAVKAAGIINTLTKIKKNQKIKVVLDCPSPNTKAWENYLLKHINFPQNLIFLCVHKADRDYTSVAAASILAKTTRDSEIIKIKKKVGVDFGSGYPSDPVTMKFLNENFKKHRKDGIFRETWGTVKNHISQKQQKKLLDF